MMMLLKDRLDQMRWAVPGRVLFCPQRAVDRTTTTTSLFTHSRPPSFSTRRCGIDPQELLSINDMDELMIAQHLRCAATEALVLEWVQKAQAINIGPSDGVKATNGRPQLEDLQRHCDNENVADFAWVTLRVSHALPCINNASVSIAQDGPEVNHLNLWTMYVLTAVFVVVIVIGLLGNLLTVAVVHGTPSLHSHTYYFLSNLACSDFFLIVFGVPFDLISLWNEGRPLGLPAYCQVMSTSISLFTYSSVLTIVALTAERFVAICYPFRLRALFDKTKVLNIIYASWIIAFVPSLFIGLQFKQVTPDFCGYNRELGDGTGICDFVASEVVPFQYPFEVNMLLTFVLPVCFILFCYVRILNTLRTVCNSTTVHTAVTSTSRNSCVDSETHTILHIHTKDAAPHRSHQAQKVVIKMLVTVTAIFFVCYMPYHIERLIVHYTRAECDKSSICLMLYPVTGLLQYFSAAVNPILYNLMSTRFRNAFRHRLHRLCVSKHCKPVPK